MQILFHFLILALLQFSDVLAITNLEHSLETTLPSIAVTEGCPSTIVGGCVNVIEGIYFEHETDLIIPAVQPLVYERDYIHLNGWINCHQGILDFYIIESKSKGSVVQGVKYIAPHTTFLNLAGVVPKSSDVYDLKIYPGELNKGLTNTSHGEISGRTHPKNTRLYGNKYGNTQTVYKGSGEIQNFTLGLSLVGMQRYIYELSSIRKPSGHWLKYQYEPNLDMVEKVTLTNDNNKTLASYSLPNLANLNFNKTLTYYVQSLDGRTCSYHYLCLKSKDYLRIYLDKVIRPDGPDLNYEYYQFPSSSVGILKAKRWQEGSYLKVDYYLPPEVNAKEWRSGRVKQLIGPAGDKGKEVILQRFVYNRPGQKLDEGPGDTEVYDADNHKTTFHYDKTKRLTQKAKYLGRGSYSLYSREMLFWSSEGDLLAQRFDAPEGTLLAQVYSYDKNGNVLVKKNFGNFSGNQGSLKIEANGLPADSQEHEVISSTYYDGANWPGSFNLKHTESNGITTYHYAYHPNTDRIAARYLVDEKEKKICRRWFYEYDELGGIIELIEDDGIVLEKGKTIGVTERHIHRYQNQQSQPAAGLPHIHDELYLDQTSGNEVFLKREVNTYSNFGKLIQQDTKVANSVFQFSRRWDYDQKGNIILEVDPLGVETTYRYDGNGNCIEKKGPGDHVIKYTYDPMNRLTKIIETSSQGEQFAILKEYNPLGQLISETNIFNQKTTYAYDDLGRVIQIQLPEVVAYDGSVSRPSINKTYNGLDQEISQSDPLGNTTL